MSKCFIIISTFLMLLAYEMPSAAKGYKPGDIEAASALETIKSDLSFLSDDLCMGRESGTDGAETARRYIVNRFRNTGLSPFDWQFTQSFREDGKTFRNVVGVVRSTTETNKTIVICAHYDHLGVIKGTIYNGADDNASGVAALLYIADAFMRRKAAGAEIGCNIVFVALDGKEKNMCGSRYFVENSGIRATDIICAINIDIIGTDLVPPGRNRNYIIALGENSLPSVARGILSSLCWRKEYGLDLSLSFYGSRDFTRIMYETGDHGSFAIKKIPAIFFTSGFHDYTYKAGDDTDIINFELLYKRAKLIFEFADYIQKQ